MFDDFTRPQNNMRIGLRLPLPHYNKFIGFTQRREDTFSKFILYKIKNSRTQTRMAVFLKIKY